MNRALLSAFHPLSYACEGCGRARGVKCPERYCVGLIQLTCPERVRAAQFYGMQIWRDVQTARRAYTLEAIRQATQPHGAA